MSTSPCPRCGAPASGKFCSQCGAPLTARPCPSCGAEMVPGATFCHRCGGAVDGTVRPPAAGAAAGPQRTAVTGDRTPWIVASVLTFVAIVAVVFAARSRNTGTPDMANAGNSGGGLPASSIDLSTMTPREQFQRLADRIQTDMEAGDTAQVVQFFPMLEGAWANLAPGDRDIDARFHMGLLRAQIGHFTEALAQADTISTEDSTNLFADYLRAMVADYQGKAADAKAARAAFVKHYPAEMKSNRPEYQAHKDLLESFEKAAEGN